MENWVDLTCSWELQFVSYLANLLEDKIWTKVFVAELVIGPALNRVLRIRLQFDIDPITHFNRSLPAYACQNGVSCVVEHDSGCAECVQAWCCGFVAILACREQCKHP